jgi:hypothetical protein
LDDDRPAVTCLHNVARGLDTGACRGVGSRKEDNDSRADPPHLLVQVLGRTRLQRLVRAGWLTPAERSAHSVLFDAKAVHRALSRMECHAVHPIRSRSPGSALLNCTTVIHGSGKDDQSSPGSMRSNWIGARSISERRVPSGREIQIGGCRFCPKSGPGCASVMVLASKDPRDTGKRKQWPRNMKWSGGLLNCTVFTLCFSRLWVPTRPKLRLHFANPSESRRSRSQRR